jgi:hypothetical protein
VRASTACDTSSIPYPIGTRMRKSQWPQIPCWSALLPKYSSRANIKREPRRNYQSRNPLHGACFSAGGLGRLFGNGDWVSLGPLFNDTGPRKPTRDLPTRTSGTHDLLPPSRTRRNHDPLSGWMVRNPRDRMPPYADGRDVLPTKS